jgi:hypothetical protein
MALVTCCLTWQQQYFAAVAGNSQMAITLINFAGILLVPC